MTIIIIIIMTGRKRALSTLFCTILLGSLVQSQPKRSERRRTSEKDDITPPTAAFLWNQSITEHVPLFRPLDLVLGPTVFPPPRTIDLQTHHYGQHRPDQPVVVAYASEYGRLNYIVFIQSLRATGFDGDIVLFVSPLDIENTRVSSYLYQVPHLILYVPPLECYNFEGETVASAKGGIRTCTLGKLDTRGPRVIATIRYELYAVVAEQYNNWMLLVDARDTYFQGNPFHDVPIASKELWFFGENMDATRIGSSPQNTKWLTHAYGDTVAELLRDKPIVCSGATLGHAHAIRIYTAAMVSEADETHTLLMGADQGFHNYLWYSGKLQNAVGIGKIRVFDHGMGIVHHLGALRKRPLDEWGPLVQRNNGSNNELLVIVNWDGKPAPVVHQYDRHAVLTDYFYKQKGREFVQQLGI